MNRRSFFPLLSAAALLPACSKEGGTSTGMPTKVLRVGMEMSYPPFEFKTETGQPDGVDVKMAEALAKYLGLELKLEEHAWLGLTPALQASQIDLIISAMTDTEERRKSVDFSDPYVHTAVAMLVGKNSSVQSAEDLKKPGIKIAVKSGTTGENYVIDKLKATPLRFESEDMCVEEVKRGGADAFIYDQLSLYGYAIKNTDTTKALLTPLQEEAWAIAIKKGNDELRGKVNAFIKDFREKGELEKLADIYLVKERKLLQDMGAPFIFR